MIMAQVHTIRNYDYLKPKRRKMGWGGGGGGIAGLEPALLYSKHYV